MKYLILLWCVIACNSASSMESMQERELTESAQKNPDQQLQGKELSQLRTCLYGSSGNIVWMRNAFRST